MDYNTTDFIFDAFQERNSDCRPFSVFNYLTCGELHLTATPDVNQNPIYIKKGLARMSVGKGNFNYVKRQGLLKKDNVGTLS